MREDVGRRVRGAVRDRGAGRGRAAPVPGPGKIAMAAAEAVFGAPVVSGGATVVPVARISTLTTRGKGSGRMFTSLGEGRFSGGLVRARPAGFLVIDGEGARYRPIRQPATALVIPLAVIAAFTATRIVGVSLREARRRRNRCAPTAAEPEQEA